MRFVYQQYQGLPSATVPSGVLHRPVVPLTVIGASSRLTVSALVDPGADETLLPRSVALQVGASIDDAQTWHNEGISGNRLSVALGEVGLEITDGQETFRWFARVGVVDFSDGEDEMVIAGHAGFLDYFRATFDGHSQELDIEVTPSFPGRVS